MGWDISKHCGPWILSVFYACGRRGPLTSSGVLYSLPLSKGKGGLSSVETLPPPPAPEHLGFIGPT